MIRFFLLLACLAQAWSAAAQAPFLNRYSLGIDSAYAVEPAPGGGAVIVSASTVLTGPTRLLAWRLNAAADVQWARTWAGANGVRPTDMLVTLGNTYVVTFNSTDSAAAPRAGWLHLADNGDLLWSFRLAGNARLARVISVQNGYVLAGAFRAAANADWQALVMKIDAAGAVVWSTTFGTNADDRLADVWADAQGQLYVAGTTGAGNNADGLVARLNDAGTLLWARRYGSGSADGFARLAPLGADRLLLAGYSESFIGSDGQLWLVAIQPGLPDPAPVWSYTYAFTDFDFGVTDLVATAGNRFVLAANGPTRPLGNPAVVLQLDQDAALNWAYRVGLGFNLSTLEDVDVLTSGLLLAGSADADPLVGRFTSTGTLPGCGLPQADLERRTVQPEAMALTTTTNTALLPAGSFPLTSTLESPVATDLLTPIDVGFSLSDSTICPGECLTITLTGSTPGATYDPPRIRPAGAQPDPNQAGVVCFPNAGTYTITRAGTLGGCRDSLSITVEVRPTTDDRQVNAFTPNGDNFNDRFRPFFACPPVGFVLHIYNRWGQLLLTTESYNVGWDGTLDGVPAPADTYFWMAEYSTSDAPESFTKLRGEVTLLR